MYAQPIYVFSSSFVGIDNIYKFQLLTSLWVVFIESMLFLSFMCGYTKLTHTWAIVVFGIHIVPFTYLHTILEHLLLLHNCLYFTFGLNTTFNLYIICTLAYLISSYNSDSGNEMYLMFFFSPRNLQSLTKTTLIWTQHTKLTVH